ncbi:hypothetical protein PN480_20465 [Dolichospermum circinale CS-1225]|jgi:hypothetical protein|uniref:Uncharacterized protein n=1 Tax=Dolichospermum circinale CS-537/01 TaxID=3021739 RepID=A0ABT5A9U8_9CYAN|nr:hypothetical protein [Dolichospermum circinale]MBD1215647.1 hypothetical protein [Dolichospermum circinale Clear-D4]MCE2719384.1 hypothetical protein [Anabaena sp. 49628_E55]MDB9457647.1 hypothetical protein [Dolichospermum circinale CS-545/17]MDB9467387.1 hypothetical protein [Dolichospermum circinale CS-539/09]MDB9470484.1 hypothetical protein [Dolichospermum circinale CS-539]
MSFYKSLLYKDFSDLTILYFNPISDKINVVSHDYDKLTEQLSLDEAEAASRRLRNLGKTISNQALLQEALERDGLVANKKSRKDRQKLEQEILRSTAESQNLLLINFNSLFWIERFLRSASLSLFLSNSTIVVKGCFLLQTK